MTNRSRGGPLTGIRVLELTKVWAGPYMGKQLAFLGAEVIKIESAGSLDVTRVYGTTDVNQAPGFQAVNPQKLGATIDMKSKTGTALLLDLASKCDILVENLRPGAIDRLGLGYEAVKSVRPDIIFVSMGMYGSDGPLAYQTGYAPCFVALGGLSALVGYEGEPPRGMNIRYADSTFGTAAAYAAVVALWHRMQTGEGQFIDVSAVECATSMIGDAIMDFTLTGHVAGADGNRHPGMAPHGAFACQGNDWISIAVPTDADWRTLATEIGGSTLADDPRFSTLAGRKVNEVALESLMTGWTRNHEAGPLAADLQKIGIAAAKSANSVDLISDEQLWARGFYPTVGDGDGNMKPIVGPGWRMTDQAAITAAAPRLGEHNAYVFGEILGLSEKEQRRLAEEEVIR